LLRRITRYVAGSILGLGGLVGVAIGVISIVDPIGTKMADDGDPFGTPPSLMRSVIITGVFALLADLGLWLVLVSWLKRRKAT
jgi:hypothetical protein